MQTVPGYGITATYDGHTLTVEGKNKATRIALAGENHGDGPVTVTRDQITNVTWKPAGRLTNGNLSVHTAAGQRYQLHFLRKHQDGMQDLARQLGAQV
ncbi:hypothetical protein ACJ5H2_13490 [Nocardioides sp. R1-1]|uniref:hypothetical protein n=1 Tax=Nocardioides sp. R1-1 TaxID=3383502 RepID=UPI0038D1A23D